MSEDSGSEAEMAIHWTFPPEWAGDTCQTPEEHDAHMNRVIAAMRERHGY